MLAEKAAQKAEKDASQRERIAKAGGAESYMSEMDLPPSDDEDEERGESEEEGEEEGEGDGGDGAGSTTEDEGEDTHLVSCFPPRAPTSTFIGYNLEAVAAAQEAEDRSLAGRAPPLLLHAGQQQPCAPLPASAPPPDRSPPAGGSGPRGVGGCCRRAG